MSDKIPFVGDESSALDGFRRILHRDFEITTATSGGEGLMTLDRDGPFAVVVSDMRMPGMSGAEFLSRVRQKAPEPCACCWPATPTCTPPWMRSTAATSSTS